MCPAKKTRKSSFVSPFRSETSNSIVRTTMTGLPDRLTPEQVEEFGREMDEIRQRIVADLGEADVDYIHNVIKTQRGLEILGRSLLFAGFLPPAWLAGVSALTVSKILDNMEIGHNVLHGQYDWTRDPALNSQRFEWD